MIYCNSQFNATDVSTLNQTVYPTTDGQPAQIKQPSSQKIVSLRREITYSYGTSSNSKAKVSLLDCECFAGYDCKNQNCRKPSLEVAPTDLAHRARRIQKIRAAITGFSFKFRSAFRLASYNVHGKPKCFPPLNFSTYGRKL